MSPLATSAAPSNKDPPLISNFILNLGTDTGRVRTPSASLKRQSMNRSSFLATFQNMASAAIALNWEGDWQSKAGIFFFLQAWPAGSAIADKYDFVIANSLLAAGRQTNGFIQNIIMGTSFNTFTVGSYFLASNTAAQNHRSFCCTSRLWLQSNWKKKVDNKDSRQ